LPYSHNMIWSLAILSIAVVFAVFTTTASAAVAKNRFNGFSESLFPQLFQ